MDIQILKSTPTVPFRKHWQFCVGSPHATYALRKDYCRQLKQVHDELGIQRVRFHGIFCDDMHTYHKMTDLLPIPGSRDYVEQSFRWCGVVYDNVLAAGMKPFVELGFMPKHLAKKNKKGLFFYKPNISPPKDHGKWYAYIQDFIRFLIDRYGREEVRQWYFEVWNEPDLRLPFFAGTQEDYFKLYETTARAIKAVDSQLMVGGPATSGSKWVAEFVRYCKEKDIPVDFVTTHEYAGDPLGGIVEDAETNQVSMSIDMFAAFRDKNKQNRNSLLHLYRAVMGAEHVTQNMNRDALVKCARKVKADAQGLPLFYTEWNMCATFGAPCNDTRMQAAYNIHSILNTQDTIDGSSIWCFTDLFEELHPFAEEFHGGFGMMTMSGIPKPTYHAMRFLQEAGSQRYVLADAGSDLDAAAFRSEDGIQLLLTKLNFSPTGQRETISVQIELDQPPKQVTLQRIDETHGNPLREWESLGSPQVPNPVQVRQIVENSAIQTELLEHTYADDTLTFTVTPGDNDVYFIRIET